ncbi:MAG: SCO family protein [Aquabacterium sp.]|nr:MAG: SCO family protein [Aquabacterium sp.]
MEPVLLTRRRLLQAAAGAAVVPALAACDRLRPSQQPFHSVDITGAQHAQGLHLPDADGRMRSLADFKGKVVVVFFGYVHCPDVCPMTMGELVQVKRQLGADGDRIQGIFVTVDPVRDTPEVLKPYVTSFDPSFIALRGSKEQTDAATRDFKVFVEQVPGRKPGEYTVNHTAGSFIFDGQGRIRLFTRYGMPQAELTEDLRRLVAGA